MRRINKANNVVNALSKRTLIIVVVALAVAVIPVLVEHDEEKKTNVLLIGLVLGVVALLVELFFAIADSKEHVIQKLGVENPRQTVVGRVDDVERSLILKDNLSIVADRPELKEFIQDLLSAYPKVESHRHQENDFFERFMWDKLRDCSFTLQGLSLGYFQTKSDGPFSFREGAVRFVTQTMDAIQADDPTYWRDDLGKQYEELLVGLINKNVKVRRVWLLPKSDLLKYKDVIQKHATLKMDVRVLPTENVADNLIEDFGVLDGYILIKPLGHDVERISLAAADVSPRKDNFAIIWRRAKPIEEYYKDA